MSTRVSSKPLTGPVLVVESDPVLRGEVVETLKRAGLPVAIAASSAVEAYQRVADCRPAAALVNLSLPVAGGLPTTMHLLKRAGELGLPLSVVLYSEMGGELMSTAARSVGAIAALTWPTTPDALATLLCGEITEVTAADYV